jgi:hypothetical protein
MLKRFVMGLAVILAFGLAQAQATAGVEYLELGAAQPTDSADKIEGVPSMAVNGKYVVITDNMKSLEQLLGVSDYLVERARKEGSKAASKKK